VLERIRSQHKLYLASLDQNSLPTPDFKILQYRPREWKPEDSINYRQNFSRFSAIGVLILSQSQFAKNCQ